MMAIIRILWPYAEIGALRQKVFAMSDEMMRMQRDILHLQHQVFGEVVDSRLRDIERKIKRGPVKP